MAILRKVAAETREEWEALIVVDVAPDAALAAQYSHPAWQVRALGDALAGHADELPQLLGDRLAVGTRADGLTYDQLRRAARAIAVRVGEEHGFWPCDRQISSVAGRFRPGSSDVMALRVGHEKLTQETGWLPKVSWD